MDKESQFNQLYDTHYTKVFRLCRGYFLGNDALASDTAQDVFIKVWEHLDSFQNQSSISTWLYRISVNTCLMHLRKQSTKKEKSTDQFPSIAEETPSQTGITQNTLMLHNFHGFPSTMNLYLLSKTNFLRLYLSIHLNIARHILVDSRVTQ